MKLFFANAPYSATEDDLRKMFEKYGVVHRFILVTDRSSGQSRGFGFVTMDRPAALVAVAALDGKWIDQRKLHVVEWMRRDEQSEEDQESA